MPKKIENNIEVDKMPKPIFSTPEDIAELFAQAQKEYEEREEENDGKNFFNNAEEEISNDDIFLDTIEDDCDGFEKTDDFDSGGQGGDGF